MITGVGIDYPETFQDLDEQFSSDDVSLDYIVKLRWPKEFCCPRDENKTERPSLAGRCLFLCRNGMVIIGSETLRYCHIVTNISGRGDPTHAVMIVGDRRDLWSMVELIIYGLK